MIKEHDTLLSCHICTMKFDREEKLPLFLKCGHSICKFCASSLLKQGRIKCPFDNKFFEYRSVNELGRNFSLLDLLDAERQKKAEPDERYCI